MLQFYAEFGACPSICPIGGSTANTDVVVAKVSLERFGALLVDQPRVAARFMLSIQQERIALMDRLAAIGRTSAEASLAAFLLDLRDRLMPLKLVVADGFELPVTQNQIGDVLGLTGAHVYRSLASLTRQGLIRREGRILNINDISALEVLAGRPDRQPFPDQCWLPAER